MCILNLEGQAHYPFTKGQNVLLLGLSISTLGVDITHSRVDIFEINCIKTFELITLNLLNFNFKF
jgi:hypothetical protein